MYGLQGPAGDQGSRGARQEAQLREIKAATLTGGPDPAEDAAGDPGTSVREKFGPCMFRLYVPSLDG